uniref:Uncharacterized protein n=1 Tax=Anopheles funestus TaxID=62324 RepID=A0A4Y0BDV8_ANOFN
MSARVLINRSKPIVDVRIRTPNVPREMLELKIAVIKLVPPGCLTCSTHTKGKGGKPSKGMKRMYIVNLGYFRHSQEEANNNNKKAYLCGS